MKLTPSERAVADEALNSAFVAMDLLVDDAATSDVWEDLLGMDLANDDGIDPSLDDVFALLRRAAALFPNPAPMVAAIEARDLEALGAAFDALGE